MDVKGSWTGGGRCISKAYVHGRKKVGSAKQSLWFTVASSYVISCLLLSLATVKSPCCKSLAIFSLARTLNLHVRWWDEDDDDRSHSQV